MASAAGASAVSAAAVSPVTWSSCSVSHSASGSAASPVALPAWLRACYPRLFAHPRLIDRLRIYAIAYEVRSLLVDPPTAPPSHQDPRSAYHRLQHLVRGTSYLDH